MENENSKVKVIDRNSGYVFFESNIDGLELASQKAAELELLGLDIELISPTLPQTLLESLGVKSYEAEKYLNSLDEELHSHENSSCSNCLIN